MGKAHTADLEHCLRGSHQLGRVLAGRRVGVLVLRPELHPARAQVQITTTSVLQRAASIRPTVRLESLYISPSSCLF